MDQAVTPVDALSKPPVLYCCVATPCVMRSAKDTTQKIFESVACVILATNGCQPVSVADDITFIFISIYFFFFFHCMEWRDTTTPLFQYCATFSNLARWPRPWNKSPRTDILRFTSLCCVPSRQSDRIARYLEYDYRVTETVPLFTGCHLRQSSKTILMCVIYFESKNAS